MGFYYVLHLNNVPADQEDELSSLLFEHGAEGVSEDLDFEQTVAQFEPSILVRDRKNLLAYFSARPSEELVQRIRLAPFHFGPREDKEHQSPTWKLTREEDADWLEEWKKGYTAFALAEDFWVVPRWETPPAEAKVSFHIEPGMAFGTGTHETTQLVVEMMSEGTLGDSFLDVGTGTGLLAFYALRQGYQKVAGIDNDPVAAQVARENLTHNLATPIQISTTPLENLDETFDVVAANIIQSVLIKLREGLVKTVRPGGVLLLSGVLAEHEEEFVAEFFGNDGSFSIQKRKQKGDWVAFQALRGGSR